ncbi:hypothetical protein BKA70DRAFT_1419410 [Coprinopsis sp. MPI-PUGE-AT-0042]|nr:hypothetical protein BKA70DRAFT_1419410 [Coprinopsis sp. MPI-PUGE-AT-0042]
MAAAPAGIQIVTQHQHQLHDEEYNLPQQAYTTTYPSMIAHSIDAIGGSYRPGGDFPQSLPAATGHPQVPNVVFLNNSPPNEEGQAHRSRAVHNHSLSGTLLAGSSATGSRPTVALDYDIQGEGDIRGALQLQSSRNHALQAQITELGGQSTYYREQAIRFREAYEREVALSQKLMETLLELRLRVYRRSGTNRKARGSAQTAASSSSPSNASQESYDSPAPVDGSGQSM